MRDRDAPKGYRPRQRVGLVLGPAVFAVVLLVPPPGGLEPAAWRTAACGLLMAIWWMTEAVPIPATSLLPLLLFPLLGVGSAVDAAAPYASPLVFLFLGGFLIALAMEHWRLHRRLALNIIALLGTRPTRIVAGFMVASAFLSMWISNTATAMMMLPIGLSVIELVKSREGVDPGGAGTFGVVLMLAIAYSCSLGGIGTLVGTPTNALLAGTMADTFGFKIGFLDWLLLALPLTIVGLAVTFFMLTRLIYPIRIRSIPGGAEYLRDELRKLGRISPEERRVAIVFGLTAGLWVTGPVLGKWLPGLSDTGIAVFGALLLFAVPLDWRRGTFVLSWDYTTRLPWGVLLLFGGGLSLAKAIESSKLAEALGGAVSGLREWPVLLLTLLVVTLIIFLTEITSNTATAAALLPVLASIAVGLRQNPLLLMVPATLAASCAFMLPVATPPNAIVYGSGFVSVPQMARAGLWLNLAFIALVTLLAFVLLPVVLDVRIGVMPPWAQ